MKVFISWSGERSLHAARALKVMTKLPKGQTVALTLSISCLIVLVLAPDIEILAQGLGDRYVSGIAVTKPSPECPCFVNKVIPESPAAAAGIKGGDRLLTIDSMDVNSEGLARILALLSSDKPGGITLKLWRKGRAYEVILERQQLSKVLARQGMKILPQGLIVPSDSTELEIERLSRTMSGSARLVAHPFPAHVPLDNDLFHGGFALLIFRDPDQVVATGIENGPASRAGIRQGDLILSVNEMDLTGKTPAELEALFIGDGPQLVELKIDRGGGIKTLKYGLERVSEILKGNHLRLVEGQIVPLGLADEDIPCYTARKQPG